MVQAVPVRSRYFTPAEADAVLPTILEPVARCAELVKNMRALQSESETRPDLADDARRGIDSQVDVIRREMDVLVQSIQAMGVELKGVEPALIDFPALHHGQDAYLCWREGEPRVSWWHPTHTGFGGRRPLDFGDLGSWEWCN